MRRLLIKVILLLLWAFPLGAQEITETCAGPVEHRLLANGANAVLQPLADRPVVAVTLAFPWGRAHDPQRCELLNRVLSRSCSRYPGGSLLLRLEELGGLSSYRTGQLWSSWTLVVPRGYAAWAVQIQLDRMKGPWAQNEDVAGILAQSGAPAGVDATALRSLFVQLYNPAEAVLAISGGFDEREVSSQLSKVAASKATQGAAPGTFPDYMPRRLAWNFARPSAPRQRAAAYLWQSALREQISDVQLDLDPAEQGYWLSTPMLAEADLDRARPTLAGSLPSSGLTVTARTRQKAQQRWLQEWDDLASRSRLLALEQARGELGRSLQTYEALSGYDLTQWRQDLAIFEGATARAEVLPSTPPGNTQTSAPTTRNLKIKSEAPPPRAPLAAPPSFVRLEYAPNCGALIQTVTDLPVVAVRAVLPGGSACDSVSTAGRAEWLAAYWQKSMDSEFPTQVESQSNGWQFSAYLPRDQVTPWLTRFFQLCSQPQIDPMLATASLPPAARAEGPVQAGYRDWLQLLFPPEHPLGRQGLVVSLSPERLQELQSQVRQQARWNIFLSGDITRSEVEIALNQAAPPQPDSAIASNWDSLPTQTQLPGEAVLRPGDVDHCTLLLGGYGPSRREADYYAFVLLLQTLAADPVRARLQVELRLKRPLAQRVDCNFLSATGPSPWLIRIDCSRENLAEIQTKLNQQLEALRQKEVRPEELELAVRRLEGQQQVANMNSTGRVQQLRNLELFHLSDSYNQGFAGIYRNVSSKDLLASARLRLLPQRLATLIITPKS